MYLKAIYCLEKLNGRELYEILYLKDESYFLRNISRTFRVAILYDMQHKLLPLTLWGILVTEMKSPAHAFHSIVKTNYLCNQLKQIFKNNVDLQQITWQNVLLFADIKVKKIPASIFLVFLFYI